MWNYYLHIFIYIYNMYIHQYLHILYVRINVGEEKMSLDAVL